MVRLSDLIGRLQSIPFDRIRASDLEAVEEACLADAISLRIVARRPPDELLYRLQSDNVVIHWLTSIDHPSAIAPDVEQIHRVLTSPLTKPEIVWFEGLEMLNARAGSQRVLAFIRQLVDDLEGTPRGVIAIFDPLAFDPTDNARLRREAPSLDRIPNAQVKPVEAMPLDGTDTQIVGNLGEPQLVEGRLKSLTRLSHVSGEILRERVLAWRKMGIDTSEIEPALHYPPDEMKEAVDLIESKIDRAIDLDRRVDLVNRMGETSLATIMRFRLRQLTGLDEIEQQLDRMLEASIERGNEG